MMLGFRTVCARLALHGDFALRLPACPDAPAWSVLRLLLGIDTRPQNPVFPRRSHIEHPQNPASRVERVQGPAY